MPSVKMKIRFLVVVVLLFSSGLTSGFYANRVYSFMTRAEVADDVCKLDGRYISPRELQGCEETAFDIQKASRSCERQLAREKEGNKRCKEQFNTLMNGIRTVPPNYE